MMRIPVSLQSLTTEQPHWETNAQPFTQSHIHVLSHRPCQQGNRAMCPFAVLPCPTLLKVEGV
eukprot:612080-Alexandrium_andersonii.AAC.1